MIKAQLLAMLCWGARVTSAATAAALWLLHIPLGLLRTSHATSTCCFLSSHFAFLLPLITTSAGEAELPGLTDEEKPRQRGPKRASKIRKMFNLTKDDDVRHYVKIYGKKVEKVRRLRG